MASEHLRVDAFGEFESGELVEGGAVLHRVFVWGVEMECVNEASVGCGEENHRVKGADVKEGKEVNELFQALKLIHINTEKGTLICFTCKWNVSNHISCCMDAQLLSLIESFVASRES